MRGDPDDGYSLKARRIGQQLAEMGMIRALQLVLDQHPSICPDVLAKNIGPKRPDRLLLSFQFKVDAQRIGEDGKIFLAR